MERYKKPVMEIVELEKVDVLTKSCTCDSPTDTNNNGWCEECGKRCE